MRHDPHAPIAALDADRPLVAALAAHDPDLATRLADATAVDRRGALRGGAALAAGLRLASVPVALATMASRAFGQQRLPGVVIGVLNFALVLEEFETELYTRGLDAAGLIPAADRPIFERLLLNERTHRDTIRGLLGASARPKPTFDFSYGNGSGTGPYADVFTNYATFTAVAQSSEDLGSRAYKGQAPALLPYDDVLTTALQIHSVEARHAAELRRLRGDFQDTKPLFQGWITGATPNVPGPATAVYQGEDNTIQGGVDVRGVTSVSVEAITEAFDEPLTQAQVLAIVDPFIV